MAAIDSTLLLQELGFRVDVVAGHDARPLLTIVVTSYGEERVRFNRLELFEAGLLISELTTALKRAEQLLQRR